MAVSHAERRQLTASNRKTCAREMGAMREIVADQGEFESLRTCVPSLQREPIAAPAMLSVFAENSVPMTIICAPAGVGKTCALSQIYHRAEAGGGNPIWIDSSVDWGFAGSKTSKSALSEIWRPNGILFVDGADDLPRDIASALISLAPIGQRKLFLSARSVATLRIARHLAAGNAQILPAELLFWQKSASERLDLTRTQAHLVHRFTEGWAAPTVLLGKYLKDGGKGDDIGVMLGDSLVSNFLEEEIIAAMPAEWRQTLIALALTDEVTDELLERIEPDGGITVEALKTALGPLFTKGSHPSSWRLNALLRHHLYTEFCRLKRPQRGPLQDVVTKWAADRGDIVAAATMLAQQGEKEKFLDLVATAGGATLWFIEGHHVIKQLVKIADDAGIAGDGRFQLLRCASLLKEGRATEASALYDKALPTLPATIEARRDAAFLQIILTIYCCRDPAPEDISAIRFLEGFAIGEGWNTSLPTIRAIHHLQRAEFDVAMSALVEAENDCLAAGFEYNLHFLDLHRAEIFLAQGDLVAARKSLLQSQARWRRDHRDDRGAETVLSALFAQLEFQSGKRRNAAAHLKRSGLRVLQSEAWLNVYVAALEPMFRLAAEQHGVDATIIALERTRDQLAAGGLDRIANLLTGLRIALLGEEWLRGDNAATVELGGAPWAQLGESTTWHEREFATLAEAYCELAAGDAPHAVDKLSGFVDYARARHLRSSLLRGLLLRAAAFDKCGDAAAASGDFAEALAIGEETGLRQDFAEFGGRYTAAQLSKRQGTVEFVRGLGRRERAAQSTTETSLTNRERQMLSALAEGKSDKAIGRDIGITEYGVRFHLRNLYAKLGVHGRAAAVAKGTLLTSDR